MDSYSDICSGLMLLSFIMVIMAIGFSPQSWNLDEDQIRHKKRIYPQAKKEGTDNK